MIYSRKVTLQHAHLPLSFFAIRLYPSIKEITLPRMANNETFILFDFDGVIVDSFHLGLAFNHQFNPSLTAEEYKQMHEGNVIEEFRKREPEKSEEMHKKGSDQFYTFYSQGILSEEPVGGIVEVLSSLAEAHRLVIISSTINAPIQQFMDQHGLSRFFDKILGGDVHPSKVEKIKMVFKEYKTDAAHCLFVTDTLGDLREAAKVDVSALAVDWGFHDRETLQKGNPVALVDQPHQIIPAVDSYFASFSQ